MAAPVKGRSQRWLGAQESQLEGRDTIFFDKCRGVWQCVKVNEQKDDKTVCLTEAHSHGQQGDDFFEKKKRQINIEHTWQKWTRGLF